MKQPLNVFQQSKLHYTKNNNKLFSILLFTYFKSINNEIISLDYIISSLVEHIFHCFLKSSLYAGEIILPLLNMEIIFCKVNYSTIL